MTLQFIVFELTKRPIGSNRMYDITTVVKVWYMHPTSENRTPLTVLRGYTYPNDWRGLTEWDHIDQHVFIL